MSEIADESLRKIGRGTIIALAGIAAGLLFGFIARIIIARYGTQSDYGVFSLALVVVNILALIAILGLESGTPRYVAFFRAKSETGKVQATISASVLLSALASILLGLALFFGSGLVATKIFHDPGLILPLKILAFSIPFLTLIAVLASTFRGFDRVEEKVYFQDMLRNVLFVLALIPVLVFNLSFISIFYSYLLAVAVCAMLFVLYTTKKLPVKLLSKPGGSSVGRELVRFSIPLLGVAMFQMMMGYTDTLMLGYFKASSLVGLYNAASPLAQFMYTPMFAMTLIYAPTISGLYARDLLPEMGRNYTIVTKWVFSASLPLFVILLLFPEVILGFLFGANYTAASQALRILAVGFLVINLLGPNGTTLMVIGKTRFLLWASAAAAGINVILNIALIPQWGIVGAAIATAISIALHCIIRHVKLHSMLKVSPLTKNLLIPAGIFTGLVVFISFLAINFLTVTAWMLALLLFLSYVIYFLVILFTKSFDPEDIMMLSAIAGRVGLDIALIKKILERFL